MSVNIYDAYIPIYVRAINNTIHLLTKGEAFTKEKGISEADVMAWRLAPDMLPFTFQVQTICNNAKNLLGKITGIEQAKVEDNEKTFAELHARLNSTLELLNGAKREQFEGKDKAEITAGRNGEIKLSGLQFVQGMGIPNLYFHVTTIYALFRSHGAPLGKLDFLRGKDA
ncbi:hypothetical protein BT63DRAFT_458523 [Microthyrium microscopicum]|uniref:Uncharacterized protein n=1 Tax=Microthyrium microscopicum TaxID=703497 RepID=A0A6A6U3I6_9PEZI|nr:hypothetical protein BT63DRAFT_458523 [Microthyrium microscopicum]